MSENPTPRCGDFVRHMVSGEKMVVAFVRGGMLAWAGYPAGMLKLEEFELIQACSDAHHQVEVTQWLRVKGDWRADAVRELYGRAADQATRQPPPLAPLSFAELRAANTRRLPLFKNAKGEKAHASDDGSDWRLSAWSNATLGELGEAANIIKKIERGDFTLDEARQELAAELADVQIYLDLLAFRAGVDLGAAVIEKFNAKSAQLGIDVRLGELDHG